MKLIFPVVIQARIPSGASVPAACEALAAFAKQNHCFVEADVNGVHLEAGPNEDPADLVAIYGRAKYPPTTGERTLDDEARGHA